MNAILHPFTLPRVCLFALFSLFAFASCGDDASTRPLETEDCDPAANDCEPLLCAGPGDCYAGYVCQEGLCVPEDTTKQDSCDCEEGFECVKDQCEPIDDGGNENGENENCDDGWTGEDCDVAINACDAEPCEHGACTDEGAGQYTCGCDFGYDGKDCDVVIKACDDAPCKNGGTCIDTNLGEYTCDCEATGFEGTNCEVESGNGVISCGGYDDCPDDQICREGVCIPHDPNASSAAEILQFSLPNAVVDGVTTSIVGTIDPAVNVIGIYRDNADLSGATPEIQISEGASILPAASEAQDFTQSVEYTVTAEDGTKRVYTVDDISQLHNFEIQRGFNIASWLYSPKPTPENRAAFFNKNDIKRLKEEGFDHIRINIDEDIIWDDNGDKIRAHGWDLLHDAIQWSQRYGMRVLVDLHTTRNHKFTVEHNALFEGGQAELDYFIDLWMQFSNELSGYSNAMVAYELLNEPIAVEPSDWNGVADATIAAIRDVEPDRTIVVGVASSRGQAASYDKLQIASTHKILATFHFYSPSVFTLFGMPGTVAHGNDDIGEDFPISYPGQLVPDDHLWVFPEGWIREKFRRNITKAWLADKIQEGLDMADRLDLPVFVGEFGVLNTIEDESRIRWIEDVVDILAQKGEIPYTYFDYKGYGFSLFNDDGTIKYPDLVDVIR